MSKGNQLRRACVRACLCASALAVALACAASFARRADSSLKASSSSRRAATASRRAAQGGERLDIRLRSLTTRATGKLTVEASEGGGHARLTALNLPDPETVVAGARSYVVWAVSGGRIVRLGELQRDARGNGGLAFDRPEGLEHYGVIVTAEATADAERPGDPVLSSRADEAAALYPSKTVEGDASKGAGDASKARGDAARGGGNAVVAPPPVPALSAGVRRAGDFYSEVDD